MSDEEAKKRAEHLNKICAEVLSSEISYSTSINFFVEHFMDALARDPKLKGNKLVVELLEKLQPLRKIAELANGLVNDIRADGNPDAIAQVLAKAAPALAEIYSEYVCNCEEINALLDTLTGRGRNGKPNDAFTEFESQFQKKQTEQPALQVSAFLIMPVQRIPRYALLLKEMIKNYSPNASESSLPSALEAIVAANKQINNNQGISESLENIKKLVNSEGNQWPSSKQKPLEQEVLLPLLNEFILTPPAQITTKDVAEITEALKTAAKDEVELEEKTKEENPQQDAKAVLEKETKEKKPQHVYQNLHRELQQIATRLAEPSADPNADPIEVRILHRQASMLMKNVFAESTPPTGWRALKRSLSWPSTSATHKPDSETIAIPQQHLLVTRTNNAVTFKSTAEKSDATQVKASLQGIGKLVCAAVLAQQQAKVKTAPASAPSTLLPVTIKNGSAQQVIAFYQQLMQQTQKGQGIKLEFSPIVQRNLSEFVKNAEQEPGLKMAGSETENLNIAQAMLKPYPLLQYPPEMSEPAQILPGSGRTLSLGSNPGDKDDFTVSASTSPGIGNTAAKPTSPRP